MTIYTNISSNTFTTFANVRTDVTTATTTVASIDSTLATIFSLFVLLCILLFCQLHHQGQVQLQQVFALLLSGFIQLYAGYMLYSANKSQSIERITGLLAMIPTLMDLKGNVELSMASRMSTTVNTRPMLLHSLSGFSRILFDNIILIQSQVTLISIFSLFVTIGYVYFKDSIITLEKITILSAISLLTSSLVCTFLGSALTILIYFISRSGHDPDDIATSVAASVGDLATIKMIGVLANHWNPVVSSLSSISQETINIQTSTVTVIILALFTPAMWAVLRNNELRTKFVDSMSSIVIATIISLVSGFIFESSNERYKQITLISPMFTGFVGNSVSTISSVISTTLHRRFGSGSSSGDSDQSGTTDKQSTINDSNTNVDSRVKNNTFEAKSSANVSERKSQRRRKDVPCFLWPKEIFNYRLNPKVSLTCRSHLTEILVPAQFLYLLALRCFGGKHFIVFTIPFVLLYELFGFALLVFMIYLTCNLVHVCWCIGFDPCEAVIPLTTSITDLCGSLFLYCFYRSLEYFGDPNESIRMDTSFSSR